MRPAASAESGPLDAPVVLIAFSRPDLTERTLARIREAAPTQLFLIADGPRPDRAEEPERCAAVRRVLDCIDWPCEVHRRYSPINLGCEANIELGLDWVFSLVDRAIVLEDDCVPDPTFFRFCAELLERFADDPRIAHVSGNALLVPESLFGGASYAFTSWASVWGWATWGRAWHEHRAVFARDHADHVPGQPAVPPQRAARPVFPPSAFATAAGRRYFTEVARTHRGDLFGWDSHWWVSLLAAGRLSVTPAVTLVHNDGFGEGATSTRSTRVLPAARAMPFPLVHPSASEVNVAVERELELVLVRANGYLARLARQFIRAPWLRTLARHVVSSRAVWAGVKVVSRLSAALRRAGGKPPDAPARPAG